jgi:negative regulator of sigma E activity
MSSALSQRKRPQGVILTVFFSLVHLQQKHREARSCETGVVNGIQGNVVVADVSDLGGSGGDQKSKKSFTEKLTETELFSLLCSSLSMDGD